MWLSIILSLFITLAVPATSGKINSHQKTIPATVNKSLLLQLVNNARKNGVTCKGKYYPPVPPLAWNDKLENAANEHSTDMMKNNYFSHISPAGTDANTRMELAGYPWKNYGENIGMGYTSEKEVVDGWLGSPGHCRNIMNRNFKEMGVARAGNYWTQDFGSK